jgi:hypothetical protein
MFDEIALRIAPDVQRVPWKSKTSVDEYEIGIAFVLGTLKA